MLVQQHHPISLTSSPPPPQEYSYDPYISSPTAVQIKLNVTKAQTSPSDPLPAAKPSFRIRRATIKDAPSIARLGATVFATTFGFSMPSKDLNAFLDEVYTVEAIEADVRSPAKYIFVACKNSNSSSDDLESSGSSETSALINGSDDEAEEIIGFTQLTLGTTEPCLSHLPSLVELQRLYVSTSHHGLGVGKHLAHRIESLARELGYKALWLGVWEGNFKAQRVYEGLGFRKVGDHEFQMGSCIQMDWIMCKKL